MSIILAIILFGMIIFIHELGHFLLAKYNGVGVVEFSLGMGPRLWSKDWKGTKYSLKLLPIGGSCMMLGEDMDNVEEGSFNSKSVWARISVIAAGPIFNFILAYLLSLIILGSLGVDRPVLLGVTEHYPAAEAGMQEGDVITSIGGKKMRLYREVSNYTTYQQSKMSQGKPITVTFLRNGEEHTVQITPQESNGRYIFGMNGSSSYREKTGILQTLGYGFYEVKFWINTTFSGLKMLVTGKAGIKDLSGPVGVVSAIDSTYKSASQDGIYYIWLNMVNMAIMITANLGVMNLLPLPALDGGRLVFLFLEAIRKKRIAPEKEGMVHFAGLMALMLLMVVVMYQDILRLIGA